MKRFTISSLAATAFIGVATLVLSGPAHRATGAEETARDSTPGGTAQEAAVDPEALKVVTNMVRYFASLQNVQVDFVSMMSMKSDGMNMNMETRQRFRLQRPNRVSITLIEGMNGLTAVADGEHLFVYMPTLGRYTEQEMTAPVDEIIKDNPMVTAAFGQAAMAWMILNDSDDVDQKLKKVEKMEYIGREKVDGVDCHHISITKDPMDVELWIDAGDPPLLRKVVPDVASALKSMGKDGEDQAGGFAAMFKKMEIKMSIAVRDWKLNAGLTKADFAFTPPEGAKKVDELFEGFGGGEEEVHALLGQPAPDFNLKSLDDKTVQLASYRDKNIVILDFWATWCGPCRQAMPTVAKVAHSYADQGVVLYAVDLEEDADTVREFLKAQELDVPVLLDSDGAVGGAYGANVIPQTVIIGKDGKVQVVHVGLLPNLKDALQEELDGLLAGRDLAAEKLAELEAKDEADKPAEDDAAKDAEPTGNEAPKVK